MGGKQARQVMPSRIKVGAMVYDVVAANGLPDMGLCDEENATIAIRAGLPSDVERITVLHEAVHAMLYALGYRKHNERVVDGLAYQMVAVLRDNPDFARYLIAPP